MRRAAQACLPAATLALTALLVGCGQTGPLYLPDSGTVVTRPAGAAASATPPSTPAPSTPAPSTPAPSTAPTPAPAPAPTPPRP